MLLSTEHVTVQRMNGARLARYSQRKKFPVRALTALTVIGLSSKPLSDVGAHSMTQCPTSVAPTIRGPGWINPAGPAGGNPNLTYRLSPNTILNGANDVARDQARNSMSRWSQLTDINATEISTTGWHVYFTNMNDPDASLAGRMDPVVDTNPTFPPPGTIPNAFWCRYSSATVRWNTNHVDNAGDFAGNDKGCIFAHETGHAFGLAHSNIASHHDSSGTAHAASASIMRGNEHGLRCHVTTPPTAPRSADVADVNGLY